MRTTALAIGLLLLPAAAGASDGAELAGSFAQMLGSLVLVVGIILILCYLANRFLKVPAGISGRYIRVVETRHLAPKKSLVLVEVGGEYLLLSNSGEGVSFLKQVELVEDIEVVDERGAAALIPPGLLEKLARLKKAAPASVPGFCLPRKNGGLA